MPLLELFKIAASMGPQQPITRSDPHYQGPHIYDELTLYRDGDIIFTSFYSMLFSEDGKLSEANYFVSGISG